MRKFGWATLAVGLVLGLAARATAADDPKAILEKAIKAHGGEAKLAKYQVVRTKTKGTAEVAGGATFTQEGVVSSDGKVKETIKADLMGTIFTFITVYDGKTGWVKVNEDDATEMTETQVAMIKETAYLMTLGRLLPLRDKAYQLAPIAEVKVNDKPAVGLRVSTKGFKDVNLYFDKDSGLMVRIDHKAIDLTTQQEVAEERIVREFQDVNGVKTAKKVLVKRDGNKFIEAEVEDIKFLDKANDKDFAKP